MKKSTTNVKFFLNILSPAMTEPIAIKAILKMARKAGINPRKLFRTARAIRPLNLPPAPTEHEIFSKIKTKPVKFPHLPKLSKG